MTNPYFPDTLRKWVEIQGQRGESFSVSLTEIRDAGYKLEDIVAILPNYSGKYNKAERRVYFKPIKFFSGDAPWGDR